MMQEQFFQENQALPENWDFIASTTNGSTPSEPQALAMSNDDGAFVQISSALGLMGTLYLRKSTITCEYAIQDLKRSISVLLGLPQTLAFDISSGGIALASDFYLNQLLQGSPFAHQGRPLVTVQIHAAASRKPCLMCLKTDCHHQSSSLKRKSRRDTSAQRASLLEPTAALKTESSTPSKKRKTNNSRGGCSSDLASSNPSLALGFSLVDSAF